MDRHRNDFSLPSISLLFLRTIPAWVALLAVAGCQQPGNTTTSVVSRTLWVMGTEASVALPAPDAARIDEAADLVEAVFLDVEQRLSRYRADSELSAINHAAGIERVVVSPLTLNTVARAYHYAEFTHGMFDPTIPPVLQHWRDAAAGHTGVPDARELARALARVDYRQIDIDPEASTVFLEQRGMVLDLGGIAKGKAVDLAAAALEAEGYDAFLIDLGGDIRCAGAPAGAPAWRVGVRNPFNTRKLLGVFHMRAFPAITTSGNYERFVEIDGQRYGHIIDPRSGQPAQGMAGVTVAAENTTKADALATALFVAGLDNAPRIIARIAPAGILMVPDRQPLEIWMTPEFKEAFDPTPEYRNAIRTITVKPDSNRPGHGSTP